MRTFFLLLMLTFVTAFPHTHAAGPVTHAYLTEKLFEKYPNRYDEEEQQRFMLGTLFPDIRYLGKIKRQQTHFEKISLKEILEEKSPFVAGMMFHSYVDNNRNTFIATQKIFSKIPREIKRQYQAMYLKLVEDQIVYEKKASWQKIIDDLKEFDPEELDKGMEKSTIEVWHAALSFFFQSSPSTALSIMSFSNKKVLNVDPEDLAIWKNLLPTSTESADFLEYTQDMILHFDTITGLKQE